MSYQLGDFACSFTVLHVMRSINDTRKQNNIKQSIYITIWLTIHFQREHKIIRMLESHTTALSRRKMALVLPRIHVSHILCAYVRFARSNIPHILLFQFCCCGGFFCIGKPKHFSSNAKKNDGRVVSYIFKMLHRMLSIRNIEMSLGRVLYVE